MANPQKLTDKTELLDPTFNDLIHVVDVSDTASSTAGTSKKCSVDHLITTVKTPVPNVDVLKLKYNNRPMPVTPVPATGYAHIPLRCFIHCKWSAGATQESSSDNLYFGYLDATTGQPLSLYYYYLDYKTDVMNAINTTSTGGRVYSLYSTGFSQYLLGISFKNGATDLPMMGQQLGIWCNDNFNGGWDADVYCTYQTIKVN